MNSNGIDALVKEEEEKNDVFDSSFNVRFNIHKCVCCAMGECARHSLA